MKLIAILLTLLILASGTQAASWYPSQNYNFTGTITSTTLSSGDDFTAAGGDSKFDLSQATGDFNTSAGTNRLNGNVTVAPTKTFTATTATITTLTNAVVSNLGAGQTRQNITADNLRASLTTVNKTDDNLRASLTTVNRTADNLRASLTTVNKTADNLRASLTTVNRTADNLRVSLTTVNGTALENKRLGYQNETEINSTADNLRASLTTVNKTADNLRASLTTVNGTASNLRASLTAINSTGRPLASFVYSNYSIDTGIFTAKGAFILTGVKLTPRVLGTDGGAVNVMVKLCDSGEAPSAGDNMLTGTLDLKGTADTPQSGTLSATTAIADGKIVALDFTGTMSSAYGVITIYGTGP